MLKFLTLINIRKAQALDIGGDTSSNGKSGLTFKNPLGEGTTIFSLLDRIVDYLIYIAVPITTIMIFYGAFQILTAAGNPEKAKAGRATVLYAAMGLGIVIISKGVSYIIKEILGAK